MSSAEDRSTFNQDALLLVTLSRRLESNAINFQEGLDLPLREIELLSVQAKFSRVEQFCLFSQYML